MNKSLFNLYLYHFISLKIVENTHLNQEKLQFEVNFIKKTLIKYL